MIRTAAHNIEAIYAFHRGNPTPGTVEYHRLAAQYHRETIAEGTRGSLWTTAEHRAMRRAHVAEAKALATRATK